MRDQHITDMLDGARLSELGEGELAAVRAHAGVCAECGRAYEAARVSSLLLRERAAETFEPSPFFQTRVMAALRERRAAQEAPALTRLWRAAGSLVSTMAATVAALAVLTFAVPGLTSPAGSPGDAVSASDPYSADAVFVAREEAADDEVDYEQVFATIYESDEAGGEDGEDR